MNVAPRVAWKKIANVWVDGEPVSMPRPRVRIFGVRKNGTAIPGKKVFGNIYNPDTADHWKECVKAAFHNQKLKICLDRPIRIDINFFFPRPKKLCTAKNSEYPILHVKKPDRDNCDKAVLDALTDIGVLRDDSVVCSGLIQKWYVAKGYSPGALVTIYVVNDGQKVMNFSM